MPERLNLPSSKPSATLVLKLLSDYDTIKLLKIVPSVKNSADSQILIKQLLLTKKQFYSRISNLIKAGLIKRTKGAYIHTSFGKMILDALDLVENAALIYMRLKAVDMIDKSEKIKKREIIKLIDSLVPDDRIRRIVKSKYDLE